MKKVIFSFILVGFLSVVGVASAQMGMMGNYYQNNDISSKIENKNLNDALQDIYETQNINSQAKVDCSKVSDEQFDKLGDAYMSVMLPNQQQHEAMDNMMGGEGSASLHQAHINMGRSYLGCWSNYNSGPIYMGMMGITGDQSSFSPLDYKFNNFNSMMSFGGFGFIFMILLWVLIIAGIVLFIRFLLKQSHDNSEKREPAINILEERYAKGEIDKKEFEEKKKDLTF